MNLTLSSRPDELAAPLPEDFARYEVLKDVIDECLDLTLNYRQSGHPGGSRSKVHIMLATLLSGAMRWDIRRPWLRFADRFVLSAGHTVPLVYATLAVLNESLRARHELDPDPRFETSSGGHPSLTWEDLLGFRHRGGLPGHAEMAGKTLFLKFNTGPSGHGIPAAAGEALALRLAGAEDVRVFALEGEGGLTPGASHETKNASWGLGLGNLVFLVDWNDYGIDERAASSVIPGTPDDWFAPYGWRVSGTEDGMSWPTVVETVLDAVRGVNPENRPSVAWFKTRKGRGYGINDAKSHGTPHPMNSAAFWAARRPFMERYGITYEGVDEAAPQDAGARERQARANLGLATGVLRNDVDLVRWTSDRLVSIAATVPEELSSFRLGGKRAAIFEDRRIYDFERYPETLWKKAGEKAPNRAALAAWGSWVNAFARAEYGRPLFIVSSADLAESTNIAGFGKDWGDLPGFGWYERDANPTGVVLPAEITEFTNAGMMAGLGSVNLASDPFHSFDGFWGATSTYGSFSYLLYGPMRLYSQMAQDGDLRLGKLIWIAGHSGPETAEDSRTHFGIFETGVTQLFPEGQVIDVHPWEYNEVPVVLGAALAQAAPIVALHLTRPPIEIPDRAALGIPSHFAAARGAYVMRDYAPGRPKGGTVVIRGTATTANLMKALPEIDRAGLNVKVVAAISPQLFRLQDEAYRRTTLSSQDRLDAMVVTNGALRLICDWVDSPIAAEYSLSSDWDKRWRTGGSLDEVLDEAHLAPSHLLSAIERFVHERPERLRRMRDAVETID